MYIVILNLGKFKFIHESLLIPKRIKNFILTYLRTTYTKQINKKSSDYNLKFLRSLIK